LGKNAGQLAELGEIVGQLAGKLGKLITLLVFVFLGEKRG